MDSSVIIPSLAADSLTVSASETFMASTPVKHQNTLLVQSPLSDSLQVTSLATATSNFSESTISKASSSAAVSEPRRSGRSPRKKNLHFGEDQPRKIARVKNCLNKSASVLSSSNSDISGLESSYQDEVTHALKSSADCKV